MKRNETKLKKIKLSGINKTYIVGSFYILSYIGLSFLFSNMLSDKGRVIKDLETEQSSLLIEKKDLLVEKNNVTSLGFIREHASELGYLDANFTFIKDSDNLALR